MIRLNAQIEVLNVTNDKQLAEISDLKANDIVSKNTIQTLNDTVSNMTSKSKLNAIIGILFAITLKYYYVIWLSNNDY